MVAVTYKMEFELSGVGNGWTDVSADVRISSDLKLQYGIAGSGPNDRVAATGQLTFALDNMATNSAGKLGYYSPNNANVRTGFGLGIGVRWSITYSGTTYYKFAGLLSEITPEAGQYGGRSVHCVAVDWMDVAARYIVAQSIGTQVNQRSDQVFTTIVNSIAQAPYATSTATGVSSFPYALDQKGSANSTALSEFQRVATSELGFIYVKGDTSTGGVLTFEKRTTRLASTTNAVTFSNSMKTLLVTRKMTAVINDARITVHPRDVDGTTSTVLYSLPAGQTRAVDPGTQVVLIGSYRDPAQRKATVGGTDMQTVTANTDYTMNSAADGSGTDLTANFSVVAELGASQVRYTITNNGTISGFITLLQCRGRGIYDYEQALMESTDSSSITSYGLNYVEIDMVYQRDVQFGQSVADWVIHIYGQPITFITSVGFLCSDDDTRMLAALQQDISSRIGITETVTGLTTVGYFINQVTLTLSHGWLSCEWLLAPADTIQYWLLGEVGASELDTTAVLGFV